MITQEAKKLSISDFVDPEFERLKQIFLKEGKLKKFPSVLLQGDIIEEVVAGGDFRRRQLSFANIMSSNLQFADFEEANLIGTLFWFCSLYGANLRGANLGGAEIDRCNCMHLDLRNANLASSLLSHVNFRCADLSGANLSECIMVDCDFAGALFDENTILPFDGPYAQKLGMSFVEASLSIG